jgi:hypothetical protein
MPRFNMVPVCAENLEADMAAVVASCRDHWRESPDAGGELERRAGWGEPEPWRGPGRDGVEAGGGVWRSPVFWRISPKHRAGQRQCWLGRPRFP